MLLVVPIFRGNVKQFGKKENEQMYVTRQCSVDNRWLISINTDEPDCLHYVRKTLDAVSTTIPYDQGRQSGFKSGGDGGTIYIHIYVCIIYTYMSYNIY